MSEHKYILEKYRGRPTRHECPACKQLFSFARYIDTETGQYVANDCGRCNREDKCGYHRTPKQYFEDHPETQDHRKNYCCEINMKTTHNAIPQPESGRIPKQYIIQSLGYDSNFVAFLCSIFDRYTLESPTIERLMSDYYLGCTKDKSVIFWQLDGKRIRTGKIMQYNPLTGKRVKNASGAIDWVHSKLKRDKILPDDFNLVQCLFGEHLLRRYPDKTVCLAESEKSAVIGAGVMPEYLWLSTGGKQNLNADKCRVLKGRSVIVFPDLGAFDDWSEKAARIERAVGCKMIVADMLERIATNEDRANGLDIADYLIRELRASSPEIGNPITENPEPGNPGTRNSITEPIRPPTDEEQALQHLGNLNPNVYALIDALGLVSARTGERLRTQIN